MRGAAPEQAPATLHEMLLAPEIQPQVVVDCEALVNAEVSDMSGISGTSSWPTIVKACNTVRGGAIKHVKAALRSVGALVEKYA